MKATFSFLLFSFAILHAQLNISGTVTDTAGAPIANALITLSGTSIATYTDHYGYYSIASTTSLLNPISQNATERAVINNGRVSLSLQSAQCVRIDEFAISGRLNRVIADKYFAPGKHLVTVADNRSPSNISIIRISTGENIWLGTINGLLPFTQEKALSVQKSSTTAASTDKLHVSRAGFRTQEILLAFSTDTIVNVILQKIQTTTGSSPNEDGSAQRIARYGNEQIFWGELNRKMVPLVKIITAVTEQAVDVYVIFNPHFTDNTYGTGSVGWGRNRRFHNIVRSNHVELAVKNGDGNMVFKGKLDQIDDKGINNESGYAALGPFGGDGEIEYIKNPDHILSYGTSTCDNINYHGYHLFENSPQTDDNYTPNQDYPSWEYLLIYRITFDQEAFGESGYGGVQMTHVHSSPAKGNETIEIETRPDLHFLVGSSDDPFRFINPSTLNPDPIGGGDDNPIGGGDDNPIGGGDDDPIGGGDDDPIGGGDDDPIGGGDDDPIGGGDDEYMW